MSYDVLEEEEVKPADAPPPIRCSFCHKSQDAVAFLISSPTEYPRAYICDECVVVCGQILAEARASGDGAGI
jgi:ATP-dependent Clp protease ATP-binding subunit ClpX